MTEVLKTISIGLMSRGNDLVSFVSRRPRPLSADWYFDGRNGSSVGAIDEREAGFWGLGGLTIQTIQIAAPATHARYAGR